MYNCIFTPHCTESFCDQSCPAMIETSYLLERNGLSFNSFVFSDTSINYEKAMKILDAVKDQVGAYVVDTKKRTTVQFADIFTYVAICQNWQGNRLHCNVYNLRFSKYVEEIRRSWTTKVETEELEYMKIFASSAKVLIVSNFDYVSFNEFESQTMLNLIQSRQTGDKTTLIISPPIGSLVGSRYNQFMDPMRHRLGEAARIVSEVNHR